MEDSVIQSVWRTGDTGALTDLLLREERDAAGKLVHVTLFLRPYRVVRAAIAIMQQRLADSPLPTA